MRCRALHALGRPILLAVSRKDFVGAITLAAASRRSSRARWRRSPTASTPACTCCASTTSRTSADFLAVRAVLEGERESTRTCACADGLRREPR